MAVRHCANIGLFTTWEWLLLVGGYKFGIQGQKYFPRSEA